MIGPLPPLSVPSIVQPSFQPAPARFALSTLLPSALPSVNAQPVRQAPPLLKRQLISPAGYPLTIYTLPNGHRIMVEQRPSDVIGLRTFVNGGSVIENGILPSPLYRNIGLPSGIAHLDEHCHFLASQNFPQKNSWHATVDALAAQVNASTDAEMIQHQMFFNREDTDVMLRLHAESVLRPLYNPQHIGQEKTNVLNETAMYERNSNRLLRSKVMELLYDRPGNQTSGKPEDVMATTPQDLARLNHMLYAPTNMVTLISGNVNPDAVLGVLGPEFGNNPTRVPHSGNQALRIALRPGEVRSARITDSQISNSAVGIAFPAPSKSSYVDRMAMEFLQEILDGDDTSVLQSRVVNDQCLAGRLDSEYVAQKQSGIYFLRLEVTPGQEQRALQGTMNTLGTISQGLIPDERLAGVRERLIRRFQTMHENIFDTTLEMGSEAVHNTLPYFLNYEQIANLITAEDLQRVARQYLRPDTYAVVFSTPAKPQPSPQPFPQPFQRGGPA